MQTKTNPPMAKQFVTNKVDGFPDGHPLKLRTKYPDLSGAFEFMGERVQKNGIQLIALLQATPEIVDLHVRVKLLPMVAGRL